MIRAITADDHPLVRAGIRYTLEKTPDIRVVAEVESGAQLLAALKKTPCDIVLMDVMMPGKDAFTLIEAIRANHPNLPILIVSTLPEEENALRLMNAGAKGYYNK
ncbi:MAG: response regulator transcription factor, partial [Desulfatibacillaceae bacterium]|nr:response regulator transcription factor [Desulfatibacillaceae bacterium]